MAQTEKHFKRTNRLTAIFGRSFFEKLPSLIPIAISLVGFSLSIYIYFPGWLSPDSVQQLQQAINNHYRDWHPPLMAWWWNKLFFFGVSPVPLLVQNTLLYWTSWALFSIGLSRYIGAWGALLPIFGFWPGLLMIIGNLWKDVVFSTSLTAAFAILFLHGSYLKRPNLASRFLIVALTVLAVGSKPNGIVVIPILAMYWLYIEKIKLVNIFFRFTLALFATGSIFIMSLIPLIRERVDKQDSSQYFKVWDLVAISLRTKKNFLPSYLNNEFEKASFDWKQAYNTENANQLFWPSNGKVETFTSNLQNLTELTAAWKRAVLAEPKEYFIHRAQHFMEMLGLGKYHDYTASMRGIWQPNPLGLSYKPPEIASLLFRVVDAIPMLFYSPWLYFIGLIISAGVLRLRVKALNPFIATMFISSLAFVAPHFFIGPAIDFRYFLFPYTVSVTLIGMMALYSLSAIRVATRIGKLNDLAT